MDNVVSITSAKTQEKNKPVKTQEKQESGFEEIIKRNAENAERVRKERLKNNEGVTRSYRLKR